MHISGAQILGARSLKRLICTMPPNIYGPPYETCFMSLSWHLEF